MSDLDNAREVLTAYDELVDSLRARVAELEAQSPAVRRTMQTFEAGLKLRRENDALRARVAELEVEVKTLRDEISQYWEPLTLGLTHAKAN